VVVGVWWGRGGGAEGCAALVAGVFDWLEGAGLDHNNFWRGLADGLESGGLPDAEWVAGWRARGPDAALIRATSPAVVPRNHMVAAALAAAEAGDMEPVRALVAAVAAPYAETAANAAFRVPARPEEAVRETFCGT